MTKHHGRRGNGPLVDTWKTALDSHDGLLFSLGTFASRWWSNRLVATGLVMELGKLPTSVAKRKSLWRQRSVAIELAAIALGEAIGFFAGFTGPAYLWLLASLALFLVLEAANTATEWLIDAYQAREASPGETCVFVRLIKHVAAVGPYVVNVVGGLGWLVLLVFPVVHVTISRSG